MITRLVGRIQRLLPLRNSILYLKSDDGNNRDRGQSSPFFGKARKQNDNEEQGRNKHRENPFRPKNLTKKSMEDKPESPLASQRDEPSRFKSNVEEKKETESFFLKEDRSASLGMFQKKKIELAPPAPPPVQEKDEEDLKLFAGLKLQDQIDPEVIQVQKDEVIDKLILHSQFYEQLSQDWNKLLDFFEREQWTELNSLAKSYEAMASEDEVQKQLNHFFCTNNASKFLSWFSHNQLSVKSLSPKILKILFTNLIHLGHLSKVIQLAQSFDSQSSGLDYFFLESIFLDLEEKAPRHLLKSVLPLKIKAAQALLQTVNPSLWNREQSNSNRLGRVQMGVWFTRLWTITRDQQLCMDQFIDLFESLLTKHAKNVSPIDTHSNGVFLDIMETYYYGSHITTPQIGQLFEHLFHMRNNCIFLHKFKDSLKMYRIKTGKSPFPNAKRLMNKMKHHIKNKEFEIAIFYYVLCQYVQERPPFRIFEQDKSLLPLMKMDQRFSDIIHDSLLSLPKEWFEQSILVDREGEQVEEDTDFSREDNYLETYNDYNYEQKQFQVKQQPTMKKIKERMTSRQNIDEIYEEVLKGKNHNQEVEEVEAVEEEQTVKELTEEQLRLKTQQMIEQYHLQPLPEIEEFLKAGGEKIFSDQKSGLDYQLNYLDLQDIPDSSESESVRREDEVMIKKYATAMANSQGMFVNQIQYTYRAQLREEADKENNFYRRQLLKLLIVSEDPLEKVKAAVKLGKLELAFTIFKQKLMQNLIQERMVKNVQFVAKACLRDHNKDTKQVTLHQTIDSITLKAVELLIQDEMLNLGNGQESLDFFGSIYEKMENFDLLLWKKMPPSQIKHDFWESTLIMERSKELIKMDINGKLNNFAYQPETEELPERKVKQIEPDLDWRTELIYSLGIPKAQAQPQDKGENYQSDATVWLTMDNKEQLRQYLINPMLYGEEYIPEGKIRYYGPDFNIDRIVEVERTGTQHLFKEQYITFQQIIQQMKKEKKISKNKHRRGQEEVEEAAELEAAEEQGEAPVEEQAEAVEEQVEAEEEQVEAAAEGQAQTTVLEGEGEKGVIAEEGEQGLQAQETQQDLGNVSVTSENIYSYSKKNNVKGYDFNTFLEQTRQILRPMEERQYEEEKGFIKYMLAMEAIAEQARIGDNHSLQKKLNEAQQLLTAPEKIALLIQYRLWNFDFLTVEDPAQYPDLADSFRDKFFKFKLYMGEKNITAIPDHSKRHVNHISSLVANRKVSKELVEELLILRHDLFKEAEAVVKLEPNDVVEQIITWGLLNDEPMGIYLGEKMAMLTNQKISHETALNVGKYMSHRREVPESRILRCKEALKIIGRISREHIYELSKDYEHITVRKRLNQYLDKRRQELDEMSLEYLTRVDPIRNSHRQVKPTRGGLTV